MAAWRRYTDTHRVPPFRRLTGNNPVNKTYSRAFFRCTCEKLLQMQEGLQSRASDVVADSERNWPLRPFPPRSPRRTAYPSRFPRPPYIFPFQRGADITDGSAPRSVRRDVSPLIVIHIVGGGAVCPCVCVHVGVRVSSQCARYNGLVSPVRARPGARIGVEPATCSHVLPCSCQLIGSAWLRAARGGRADAIDDRHRLRLHGAPPSAARAHRRHLRRRRGELAATPGGGDDARELRGEVGVQDGEQEAAGYVPGPEPVPGDQRQHRRGAAPRRGVPQRDRLRRPQARPLPLARHDHAFKLQVNEKMHANRFHHHCKRLCLSLIGSISSSGN